MGLCLRYKTLAVSFLQTCEKTKGPELGQGHQASLLAMRNAKNPEIKYSLQRPLKNSGENKRSMKQNFMRVFKSKHGKSKRLFLFLGQITNAFHVIGENKPRICLHGPCKF